MEGNGITGDDNSRRKDRNGRWKGNGQMKALLVLEDGTFLREDLLVRGKKERVKLFLIPV